MRSSVSGVDDGAATRSPAPLGDEEFARQLVAFQPFEPAPLIAVAVSGGADSLALTLLAGRWARARGGQALALTVDHGLRPGAAAEAECVGRWLRPHGIAHATLRWKPDPDLSNRQAAARDARYRLLFAWCRDRGVLHLMTGHHASDQAETVLLRLGRGSGLHGLAGMAAVEEHPHCRLIRPLLGISPDRLSATLLASRQDWIEDPSNQDPRSARVRVRRSTTTLESIGLAQRRLISAARNLGRARIAVDANVDTLLAAAARLDPAGFARVSATLLYRAPSETRLRVLAAILATVSGAIYPPRLDQLEALDAAVRTGTLGRGKTLCGCQIVAGAPELLIYRERRAVAGQQPVTGPGEWRWDGRFVMTTAPDLDMPADLSIGALGAKGVTQLDTIVGKRAAPHLPRRLRPTLPGLWVGDKLTFAPYFSWSSMGWQKRIKVRFRPSRPLSSVGFVVG